MWVKSFSDRKSSSAFCMKSWLKRAWMLGRSAVSYCRHWHRKCSNSAVKPCALNSRGKLSLVCGWLNIYEVPGRQLPVQ